MDIVTFFVIFTSTLECIVVSALLFQLYLQTVHHEHLTINKIVLITTVGIRQLLRFSIRQKLKKRRLWSFLFLVSLTHQPYSGVSIQQTSGDDSIQEHFVGCNDVV